MRIDKINFSRRRMLQCTGCGFLLSALIVDVLPPLKALFNTTKDSDTNISLLRSLDTIGKMYLQQYPTEVSKNTLISLIKRGAKLTESSSLNLSWDQLNEAIRDDFRADNVVFLDGWVFSRTEARFAALLAAEISSNS